MVGGLGGREAGLRTLAVGAELAPAPPAWEAWELGGGRAVTCRRPGTGTAPGVPTLEGRGAAATRVRCWDAGARLASTALRVASVDHQTHV